MIDGRTSIDYIIDPTNFDPTGIKTSGVRLLLLDDVGNVSAAQVSAAWKNTDASGLVAKANDIVEWNGTKWIIVFDASATTNVAYTTNLNTSVQYRFTDGEWLLSVDGEYPVGTWRVDLYG